MQFLGTIARLQYQTDHLKVPRGRFREYRPDNIVPVEELRFTADGAEAGPPDAPVYDVHHRLHPHSRNRSDNGVSIGFTGHYAAMRERLGERIVEGVAGENILIDYDGIVSEADLASGLLVETLDGPVEIDEIFVAAPCVEFSRYALDYPPDEPPDRSVTETVAFLHNGIRGFYAIIRNPGTLRVGDRVYLRD